MNEQTRITGTSGAAKILGVSPPTVHALVDRREIPCERTETGRRIFRVDDLMRFAAERALKTGGGR